MNNIELLKDLTQTTYDSVDGYRVAAENSDSPTLKRAFSRRGSDREALLNTMNNVLEAKGEEPITSVSAKGKAHQFLTSADTFVDGDEAAVKRVEQGEEYLADKFREALDSDDLDTNVRQLIVTAHKDIREGERFADMLKKQYADA